MVSAVTEEQSDSLQKIASASQRLAKIMGELQEEIVKFRYNQLFQVYLSIPIHFMIKSGK